MTTILSNNSKVQVGKQNPTSTTTPTTTSTTTTTTTTNTTTSTTASLKYANYNVMSSVYDAACLVFADSISPNRIEKDNYHHNDNNNIEQQIQGLIFKINAGLLMSKCWSFINCSTILYHIELIIMLASYSMQLKVFLSKLSSSSSSSSSSSTSSFYIDKNKIKCSINLIQNTKNELKKVIKILNDMLSIHNRDSNDDSSDNIKHISNKNTITTTSSISHTTKLNTICNNNITHFHDDNNHNMKHITYNYYHLLYDKAKKLFLNI